MNSQGAPPQAFLKSFPFLYGAVSGGGEGFRVCKPQHRPSELTLSPWHSKCQHSGFTK